MPTKTMCALVAMLFCFSAIAADKPNAQQSKLASDAFEVLGIYCGKCHGTGGAYYDEMQINREWLLDEGLVVPNKPNESLLYTIINKKMPPKKVRSKLPEGKVPEEKLDIIKRWIEAGAPGWGPPPPPPPITHEQMLKWMHEDLMKQPEGDRRDVRYFTLTHLYNAGRRPETMDNYRTALSKLINSLSWKPKILNPVPIDKNQTILRIFLTDYAWDPNIWDEISLKGPYPYPYNINYPASKKFPDQKKLQEELEQEAKAAIPFIRADWFIANAAKPQLYHEILQLPETDLELEAGLKLKPSVTQNIQAGVGKNFMRAGFLESGVSRFNRIVERHVAPNGAYWKSYDFSSNKNEQNIFRFPLGPSQWWPNGINNSAVNLFKVPAFQQAGGEIIFTLPNKLQGYFLVNEKGKRIDKAPVNIVRNLNPDPGNEPEISNGLSCMTCHTKGMKRFDKRAPDLLNSIKMADANRISRNYKKAIALRTYSEPKAILDQVLEDRDEFMKAVKETGSVVGNKEPIALLATQYESPLDINLAAGELGVTAQELKRAINQINQLQEYGLHTLLVEDGPGIARESWEENYETIYDRVHDTAIGLNGGNPPLLFPLILETNVDPHGKNKVATPVSVLAWSPDPKGEIIISRGLDLQLGQGPNNLGHGDTLFEFDAINWEKNNGVPPIIVEPRIVDLPIKVDRTTTFDFSPKAPNRLAVTAREPFDPERRRAIWPRSVKIFDLNAPGRNPLEISLKQDKAELERIRRAVKQVMEKEAKPDRRPGSRPGVVTPLKLDAGQRERILAEIRRDIDVQNFAWSPDEKKIALVGRTSVHIDLKVQARMVRVRPQSKSVALIVDSVNGREIARRELIDPVGGVNQFLGPLDWSPDGDMLALLVRDRAGVICQIWDAEDGGRVGQHVFQQANAPLVQFLTNRISVDWAPKNNRRPIDNKFTSNLALTGSLNNFTIVRIGIDGNNAIGQKNVVFEQIHVDEVFQNKFGRRGSSISLAWSLDGERLAVGSNDGLAQFAEIGEITIWDPNRLDPNDPKLNEPIQRIGIHPAKRPDGNPRGRTAVSVLAWRPDRRHLAAGLQDGTIRVFDKLK